MINSVTKHNHQWAISVAIFLYSYLWSCNAWNLIGYRKVSSCRFMSMDFYDESDTLQSKKRKSRIRPHRLSSSIENIHQVRKIEAQELKEKVLHDPNLFSNVKFKDRDDIHPSTKRAILEILKLQEMTQIQLQSYPHILDGKNVVGRSKTGTGKTLAYLLPAMQRLFMEDKNLYIPGKTIGILIIAPTRELVQQIASQATSILTYHPSDMTVVSIYGGMSIQRDIQLLSNHHNRLPTVLVATPGRLLEHLEHTKLGPRKFCDILDSTKILVLDEMDRLLDMGFQKDVSRILSFLPRNRQNLLFSATMSKSTKSELHKLLGSNYEEVNCVSESDEINFNQIEQSYLILDSMDQYIPTLILLIRNELETSKTNVKILIFLPTTWLVSLVVACFQSTLKNVHILQLHSRMSQSARQRTSDSFRTTQLPSILVSTDISSRGMDYPDVSLVLQYGYPDKDDTYLHRLGRTGRAGREGKGIQVLLPFEHYRISKLQNQGVNKIMEFVSLNTDSSMDTTKIKGVSIAIMEAAVKSFLAYYLEQAPKMKMTPIDIIQQATALAKSLGLSNLPTMSTKTATRLGIEHLIPMEEEL